MTGILDFGTTNAKLYLCQEGRVVCEQTENLGIKDFSNHTAPIRLEQFIAETAERALARLGLGIEALKRFVFFGMITSETGLLEVPHMEMPASLQDLRAGVYHWREQTIFPPHVEVLMIRGVKKALDTEGDLARRLHIDFMRGEETQCTGIRKKYAIDQAVNIVMLSSHTKMIHIDGEGRIADCVTTLTGQLFELLSRYTIVGKSISAAPEELESVTDETIRSTLQLAERILSEDGFTRGVMLPRFMELFTDMTAAERCCYVDGLLATEDVKSLGCFLSRPERRTNLYILIGHELQCRIYREALRKAVGSAPEIRMLTAPQEQQEVAVLGALTITEPN